MRNIVREMLALSDTIIKVIHQQMECCYSIMVSCTSSIRTASRSVGCRSMTDVQFPGIYDVMSLATDAVSGSERRLSWMLCGADPL